MLREIYNKHFIISFLNQKKIKSLFSDCIY